MKKKTFIITLLFCAILFSGYKKPETYVIDSEKNAAMHNNLGLMYMKDYWWYPAIQEFKIAISLSPNVQASSVYYNNLGECYMKVGAADLAQDCFERALGLYTLNFKYYQNLADCYQALGLVDAKIAQTYQNDNPLNMIMRGLLLEQKGQYRDAIVVLDEFTAKEPDLIITAAVKDYIKKLVSNMYSGGTDL